MPVHRVVLLNCGKVRWKFALHRKVPNYTFFIYLQVSINHSHEGIINHVQKSKDYQNINITF